MLNFFHKRSGASAGTLTPPDGMGRENIATESSVCTGETLIGFRSHIGGKLQQAVVVRSREDIAAFYRAYGYEPPQQDA